MTAELERFIDRMSSSYCPECGSKSLPHDPSLLMKEPKDVDSHPMRDYMMAFTDLLNDEAVLGFFTSLASLGQTAGLTESRK